MDASTVAAAPRCARWLDEAERLDVGVYAAIARTPTPAIDHAMSRLSRAADYSRLSLGSAAVLAVAGGRGGRRAAVIGLASVAVTATVANLIAKPLGRRRRPDRAAQEVPLARQVRMPVSSSFPSGHTAAAFAFATGVARVSPAAAAPPTGAGSIGRVLPRTHGRALSRRRRRWIAPGHRARRGDRPFARWQASLRRQNTTATAG